jgi:hypothetical protein
MQQLKSALRREAIREGESTTPSCNKELSVEKLYLPASARRNPCALSCRMVCNWNANIQDEMSEPKLSVAGDDRAGLAG